MYRRITTVDYAKRLVSAYMLVIITLGVILVKNIYDRPTYV